MIDGPKINKFLQETQKKKNVYIIVTFIDQTKSCCNTDCFWME